MLRLTHLSLRFFKNHTHKDLDFTQDLVALSGANGRGKTNILEAIYYLSFTKSCLGLKDADNRTLHTQEGFRIQGRFVKKGELHHCEVLWRYGARKKVYHNQSEVKKIADYIGLFPSVWVAPDNIALINEGAQQRRRFIDALLMQIDPTYWELLFTYNRILASKNALLKMPNPDLELLAIYNQQLKAPNDYIYAQRKKWMQLLFAYTLSYYQNIAHTDDGISLAYDSIFNTCSFSEILEERGGAELRAMRPLYGIHRDDIALFMSGQALKKIASQGQKKTLLFALKLSEYKILSEIKKIPPLLLLDDIFEKLDLERLSCLLHLFRSSGAGQIFVSDVDAERMTQYLRQAFGTFQICAI